MRKYAIYLVDVLNKKYNTNFKLKDFRVFSSSKYLDPKTRALFKTSSGFSIYKGKIFGLVLTHPYNKNIEGLVDTILHEFNHTLRKDYDEDIAEQYAKENTPKYVNLLKQIFSSSK